MNDDVGKSLSEIGICLKSKSGVVEYQNQKCLDICGQQIGIKCEKGCILRYVPSLASRLRTHHQFLKSVDSDGHVVDAMMVETESNLTTLLFVKDEILRDVLSKIEPFDLSKSELCVIEKFLRGISNHEIAEQLFVSRATIRTHLNNIYKKIPIELKQEILAIHFGVTDSNPK